MDCHTPCGACCIAPEISSALPNMPDGKPAGIACVNLGPDLRCQTYDIRPAVCRDFSATAYTCGTDHGDALKLLGELERQTRSSL
jgi:uncharacterized protein